MSDPTNSPPMTHQNKEGLEALIEQLWIPEPNSGCWIWLGETVTKGYGRFRGKRAHRVTYELFKGPVPEGLVVDHLCRNHICVNPDHLEAVTGKENTLRGFGPTAQNKRKTHCKHGHEFTPENTWIRVKRGVPGRECRACYVARYMALPPLKADRRAAIAARKAARLALSQNQEQSK